MGGARSWLRWKKSKDAGLVGDRLVIREREKVGSAGAIRRDLALISQARH